MKNNNVPIHPRPKSYKILGHSLFGKTKIKFIGLRVSEPIFEALHKKADKQGITITQMLMPVVCKEIGAEYSPETIKFYKLRK